MGQHDAPLTGAERAPPGIVHHVALAMDREREGIADGDIHPGE